MDGQHHDPVRLHQLPAELLHAIFTFAQNPFLSHVCRRLWLVLPDFASYSQSLAQDAFGVDIHLNHDMLDKFYYQPTQPRWIDFKNAIRSSMDPDSCATQELMCAQWLTVKHLRKIRRWNIRAGVESVYKIAGADFSDLDRQDLDDFLKRMESEPFTFVRTTPIYGHLREAARYWTRPLVGKAGSLKIFVNPDNFELMPIQDSKIGLIMLPFLPADRIPQQLFRQIAHFDVRSQELAEELAWTRIHEWKYGCPWARTGNDDIFGPRGRQVLRQCIVEILDSINIIRRPEAHPIDDTVQKCMRTLLGFDNVMFRAEAVTFSWRDDVSKQYFTMPMLQLSTTLAKDRPIRIKHSYYEHCFRTRNTVGLKLLVHLNHAMYNPNLSELKIMMSSHLGKHLSFDLGCHIPIVTNMSLEAMIEEASQHQEPEWKDMLTLLEEASRKAERGSEALVVREDYYYPQRKRHIMPDHEDKEPKKREEGRLIQHSKTRLFGFK